MSGKPQHRSGGHAERDGLEIVGTVIVLAIFAGVGLHLVQANLLPRAALLWPRLKPWAIALVALLVLVLLAVVILGVLRARRRRRGGLSAAEVIKQWPQMTKTPSPLASSLGGSKVRKLKPTAVSWRLSVDLAMGHHVREVVDQLPALESACRARPGGVRVHHDSERADRLTIESVTKDLLTKAQPWEPPKALTILKGIRLGTFEDGKPAYLNLVPQAGQGASLLLAGTTGWGKSSALNVILAALAGCRDVALFGIDPGGTELAPWKPVFAKGQLALSAGKEAERVIETLLELMHRRHQLLLTRGLRFWDPTPEEPEVFLLIDEAVRVSEHFPALDAIVSMGRKAGIHVVMVTQRPSSKGLGDFGKEVLAKFDFTVCMRVNNTTETNIVMGPGAAGEGWRPDQICRERGDFLLKSPTDTVVRRARSLLITPEQVDEWVAAVADRRPRLLMPRERPHDAIPESLDEEEPETPDQGAVEQDEEDLGDYKDW